MVRQTFGQPCRKESQQGDPIEAPGTLDVLRSPCLSNAAARAVPPANSA